MGFNTTASTLTLTAKLTPFGRQRLLSGSSDIITHFSLGDSDANYNATNALGTGEIPAAAGELGANNLLSNSITGGVNFRSNVKLNSIGSLRKLVESGSGTITSAEVALGQNTVSGSNITQSVVDRTDVTTDGLVNLFYSFALPISETDKNLFSGVTFANGGFSDTALSGFNQDKIVVIGIDNAQFGEKLDGKEIQVNLQTTANTYTIYSTFERTLTPLTTQDANNKETSLNSAVFGNNIAILFEDQIKRPANVATKSWGTGFGTVKPYSVNNKELYNLQDVNNPATTADTAVGIAFLDKGFIVITEPTIVNDFDPLSSGGTATTVVFNSVATEISQDITCIANRGEFATSTNATFSAGDTVRISEVGLHDINGNLLAVAKPDKHIEKTAQQFLALGIKLTV